jgi:molybdopterin-containing oxidoreductase family membrane subunit
MNGTQSPSDPDEFRLEPPPGAGWRLWLWTSIALVGLLVAAGSTNGLGLSGLEIPVAWAAVALNLTFWAGVGAAAALASSWRLLARAEPIEPLRRVIEATTLAAIACSWLFLGIQLGRPRLAYWLAPLPNSMGTWPQPRSPLLWLWWLLGGLGVAAVMVAYVGRLPAIATLRDRARGGRRRLYGALALGWRGSSHQRRRQRAAPRLLAGVTALLALAALGASAANLVTTLASGWRLALLVPHVAAAAILTAAAIVATLMVFGRAILGRDEIRRPQPLESAARLLLLAASIYAGAHLLELLIAAVAGGSAGPLASRNAALGSRAALFWVLVGGGALLPQLLRLRGVRTSPPGLAAISIASAAAVAGAQTLLLLASLDRDFLPATWSSYRLTGWDVAITLGGLGLFVALVGLLARGLPRFAVAAGEPRSPHGDDPPAAEDLSPAPGAAGT